MCKCFDKPKLNLQVDCGTNFAGWKAQWEAYKSLSGLDKESQVKQVKQLTANHFKLSSSKVQRRPKRQKLSTLQQKLSTLPMQVTSLRFESDLTLLSNTQRPSYKTYMASLQTLGHIVNTITQSGRFLVRNRSFL